MATHVLWEHEIAGSSPASPTSLALARPLDPRWRPMTTPDDRFTERARAILRESPLIDGHNDLAYRAA